MIARILRTLKYCSAFLAMVAAGCLFGYVMCLLPGFWGLSLPFAAILGWCWWLANDDEKNL